MDHKAEKLSPLGATLENKFDTRNLDLVSCSNDVSFEASKYERSLKNLVPSQAKILTVKNDFKGHNTRDQSHSDEEKTLRQ